MLVHICEYYLPTMLIICLFILFMVDVIKHRRIVIKYHHIIIFLSQSKPHICFYIYKQSRCFYNLKFSKILKRNTPFFVSEWVSYSSFKQYLHASDEFLHIFRNRLSLSMDCDIIPWMIMARLFSMKLLLNYTSIVLNFYYFQNNYV